MAFQSWRARCAFISLSRQLNAPSTQRQFKLSFVLAKSALIALKSRQDYTRRASPLAAHFQLYQKHFNSSLIGAASTCRLCVLQENSLII